MEAIRDTGEIDSFELFEEFCCAAGVDTPAGRIALFLDLPSARQTQLWRNLAARVDRERELEEGSPC
ncbi:MAG: hypothetical protein ACXVRQ_12670 [Gaiellaceae bacterium]